MSVLLELLNEVSFEQLEKQYVETGKITAKDFEEIKKATKKSAYGTWLAKKVSDKLIKGEDIYKWEEYLNIFDRRKREFEFADINQYKTGNQVRNFVRKALEFKNVEAEDPSQKKGIAKTDKFAELKIGTVDGFDVYELPKGRKDLYGASCELGSGTEWCTATGNTREMFDDYIKKGPLFIFRKEGSDERYQFHYETNQFMDKNDDPVI